VSKLAQRDSCPRSTAHQRSGAGRVTAVRVAEPTRPAAVLAGRVAGDVAGAERRLDAIAEEDAAVHSRVVPAELAVRGVQGRHPGRRGPEDEGTAVARVIPYHPGVLRRLVADADPPDDEVRPGLADHPVAQCDVPLVHAVVRTPVVDAARRLTVVLTAAWLEL
jgi:hypothetical protein